MFEMHTINLSKVKVFGMEEKRHREMIVEHYYRLYHVVFCTTLCVCLVFSFCTK